MDHHMDLTKLEHHTFKTSQDFETWLAEHHQSETSVVLKMYKKNSGVPTITYAEALDVALCYGWIDGQMKSLDVQSFVQRFTPRRPKSMWSKRNREHIQRLQAAGRMTTAGLAEVERAKADGRWDQAYDPPSQLEIPADFLSELDKKQKAKTFFDTLNRTNLYAIAWRIQTAKKLETRQKRIAEIIEKLAKGEKFH